MLSNSVNAASNPYGPPKKNKAITIAIMKTIVISSKKGFFMLVLAATGASAQFCRQLVFGDFRERAIAANPFDRNE